MTLEHTLKNYVTDVTAAITFYTPLLATSEYFIAGMEPSEVLTSRLAGIGVHAIVMRGHGYLRDKWKEKVGEGFVSDTVFNVLYQIPVYSSILATSGCSLEEACTALPAGLTIGAITGRPYGKFLDYWRNKINS